MTHRAQENYSVAFWWNKWKWPRNASSEIHEGKKLKWKNSQMLNMFGAFLVLSWMHFSEVVWPLLQTVLKHQGKWSKKDNSKKISSNLHWYTSTLLRKSHLSLGIIFTAFDLEHKMMNKFAYTFLRSHDVSMYLTSQTQWLRGMIQYTLLTHKILEQRRGW